VSGTARFALQFAIGLVLYAVLVFMVIVLFGCAGRPIARAAPQAPRFWQGCEQTTPAKPDGFQHFLCRDVRDKQWEVLVRKEGK